MIKKLSKKRSWRSKKFLGLPLPIVVLAVSAILVSAVLLTLYSEYYVGMDGDIDTDGIEALLYIDDVGLNTQTYAMPMDITQLDAGDEEIHAHTIESLIGNGNWEATFDLSAMNDIFTNPSNEWYGFTCWVWSATLDENITTLDIAAGDTETFRLVYRLNPLFMHTENDMTFDLDIDILEILFSLVVTNNWHLNDNTGTTAADSVGTDDFTLVNDATWETTIVKLGVSSIAFDGAGDYIENSNINNFEYDDAWTLSAWVYAADIVGDQYVFKKSDTSTGYMVKWGGDNTIRLQIFESGGGAYDYKTDNTFTNAAWHLIIISADGAGTYKIYVDGAEESATGTNTLTGATIVCPGENFGCGENLDGYLDEILTADGEAISTDDIASLWNSGNGMEYS